MKWSQLSPQKKLCTVCGLLVVVVVILIIDHIALHRETARLKRQIVLAAAASSNRPSVSGDVERNVNSLDSEIDALKYHLDDIESQARSFRDLERRLNYLETLVSRLDNKVEGAAGSPAATISPLEREIQSLKRKVDRHGKYIREIMDKVGMWLPADLLGR